MGDNPAMRWLATLSIVLALFALSGAPAPAGEWADGVEAYDGGDFARALGLWRKAAEAGNTEAMTAIASLYLQGEGVAPNPARAAAWYRRAAEKGDVVGQLNLGDLYLRGLGVKRDPVSAYVWFGLAAAQGHDWAAERRRDLARVLTEAERAEAEGRIKAWRPAGP